MQVALGILGKAGRADAEECVNDTYLRAWNAIPPERPHSLSAFLCRITRNLSLDRYRALHRGKRNQDFEIMLSELGDCVPAQDEGDATALAAEINTFLHRLDDETERRLFVGRYWHAYTVERLAEGYGMSRNAVSLRLHRTREKLRIYLQERGYTV
jgi:RNA polymerase sigma-70 factor (ECF subfamily)